MQWSFLRICVYADPNIQDVMVDICAYCPIVIEIFQEPDISVITIYKSRMTGFNPS